MPFSIRHRGDPAIDLPPLSGLVLERESDPEVLSSLQQLPCEAVRARLDAGHRAYVARVEGEGAGWGWVATRSAAIGELGIQFTVPPSERYLWNFVTLPSFRGRGIYPRLLQHIVRMEASEAERFWIIHAPENRASGSGIRKAGFTPAGEVSFDAHDRPALGEVTPDGAEAVDLLGLPLVAGPLAPCWRCARAGRSWVMFCAPGGCTCDYQRPDRGCGA